MQGNQLEENSISAKFFSPYPIVERTRLETFKFKCCYQDVVREGGKQERQYLANPTFSKYDRETEANEGSMNFDIATNEKKTIFSVLYRLRFIGFSIACALLITGCNSKSSLKGAPTRAAVGELEVKHLDDHPAIKGVGDQSSGSHILRRISVRNVTSNKVIRGLQVETSCSCAVGSLESDELLPGQSTVFVLDLSLEGREPGVHRFTYVIKWTGEQMKAYRGYVDAMYSPPVMLSPLKKELTVATGGTSSFSIKATFYSSNCPNVHVFCEDSSLSIIRIDKPRSFFSGWTFTLVFTYVAKNGDLGAKESKIFVDYDGEQVIVPFKSIVFAEEVL